MYDKTEIKKKHFVERMKLESKLYVLNLIPPPWKNPVTLLVYTCSLLSLSLKTYTQTRCFKKARPVKLIVMKRATH